jgi:uncharacterized DUF497 family protein
MASFNWSADKNRELIASRGVSFEQVVFYIEHGALLDDICHPNTRDYAHQRMFVVNIDGYAYLVPYVESENEIFLKTVIPSRKFTQLYVGGAK